MAPAYKVEELLALRASASDSAISLDKFRDEDAIKGEWSHSHRRNPQTTVHLAAYSSPLLRAIIPHFTSRLTLLKLFPMNFTATPLKLQNLRTHIQSTALSRSCTLLNRLT